MCDTGRIWNKSCEIDIAAINKNTKSILLGECKWTNKKISMSTLNELKLKSKHLKDIKNYKVYYALFSKSGFTVDVRKKAEEGQLFLFDKNNLTL